MPDSEKILIQLTNGSVKALEQLHQQYSGVIYSTCRKFYLQHEDAEEVVQDLFLKIWEKRESIDLQRSFKGDLFTVARNLILKKLQKRVMSITIDKYIDELNFSHIEEQLFYQDTRQFIDSVMHKLPPQKQKIFLMNRMDGKSVDEIAEELGLSRRTVESHIYQTRSLLKQKMNLNHWLLLMIAASLC